MSQSDVRDMYRLDFVHVEDPGTVMETITSTSSLYLPATGQIVIVGNHGMYEVTSVPAVSYKTTGPFVQLATVTVKDITDNEEQQT